MSQAGNDDLDRITEIRRQMRHIRRDLGGQVEDLVVNATKLREQLTDWKYYVRQYPWVVFGGAALAAYFLIPKRRTVKVNLVEPPAPPPKSVSLEDLAQFLPKSLTSFKNQAEKVPAKVQKIDEDKAVKAGLWASVMTITTGIITRSLISYGSRYAEQMMDSLLGPQKAAGSTPAKPSPAKPSSMPGNPSAANVSSPSFSDRHRIPR